MPIWTLWAKVRYRSGSTQQAAVASREAWRLERSRTPGAARVAATVASDTVSIIVSASLVAALAGTLASLPVMGNLYDAFPGGSKHALVLVALTPWWLFMLYAFGLYREPGRSIGGTSFAGALDGLTALTAASWFILVALVVVMGDAAPASSLIVFWALAIVVTPALRWAAKALLWVRPSFTERTLIVGAGSVGHLLAEKIAKHPEFRVRLVGFLDDGAPVRGGDGPIFPVVGTLDDLGRVIEQMKVSRVIVAFSRARHPEVLNVVRTCADYGVKVNIVPRLFEVVSTRAGVDDVEGIPLLDVGPVELGRFNMLVKRVFDLIVGTIMLLVASPLLIATAIAVKLDSRGPVFFRQERMGRGGKTFRIYKFRSMYAGADLQRRELEAQNEYSGPMFKIEGRPARHPRGVVHPALEPRRAPSAPERDDRRHEPGGPTTAVGRRGATVPRLDPQAPRHHARDHRALAGARPQQHPLRRDGQARLHVRDRLDPGLGPEAAARDRAGGPRQTWRVLSGDCWR